MMKEYKQDFIKFFEMQLTKQGADLDPSGSSKLQSSTSNPHKMPKRKKHSKEDSVDSIAKTV